jgi:hypothetical protein
MCGGDLDVSPETGVGTCRYCGSAMTLPKINDDRRAMLYERAGQLRRDNDYDRAMAVYESILAEDPADAEAYWSLVLCRYGVEYVEDPKTRKMAPTCNRTQIVPIFADEDYRRAVAHADDYARSLYEEEARALDAIQKGILEVSRREEPFDVFLCYKETDDRGRRTPDSVIAQDIYGGLTEKGHKAFFSRITLEDKLGTAYEPYIFAALNSAKVMLVLGTRAEYFNSAWMRNEWGRYLALIKSGAKKTLIPAYRGMDPSGLPEELANLQAQDLGKLGFMQDLLRGIEKIVNSGKPGGKNGGGGGAPTVSGSGGILASRGRPLIVSGSGGMIISRGGALHAWNPEEAAALLDMDEATKTVRGCSGETGGVVVIPEGVVNIGPRAFAGRAGIETLMILDGVTSIPGPDLYFQQYAFSAWTRHCSNAKIKSAAANIVFEL